MTSWTDGVRHTLCFLKCCLCTTSEEEWKRTCLKLLKQKMRKKLEEMGSENLWVRLINFTTCYLASKSISKNIL